MPGCTPEVLGQHPALGVLVMSYLPPGEYRLWKAMLRDGVAEAATARDRRPRAGAHPRLLGGAPELAAQFDSDAIFFDIRLEPYLLADGAAPRRPRAGARGAGRDDALAPRRPRARRRQPEEHPGRRPAARCCSMPNARGGATRRSTSRSASTTCCSSACGIRRRRAHSSLRSTRSTDAYLDGVDWEPRDAIERRAAALLPGLLLARVDGKSPVEYVTEEAQRALVRKAARALLRDPVDRLRAVGSAWRETLDA